MPQAGARVPLASPDSFEFLLKGVAHEARIGVASSELRGDDDMTVERTEPHLADSIVYLCTLLANRPRPIDNYIDYFGDTPRGSRDTPALPNHWLSSGRATQDRYEQVV
jgi:hypothetical protein